MKKITLCFLSILLTASSMAFADQVPAPKLDWSKIKIAWGKYTNYPSGNNALGVYELLPKSGHIKYSGTVEEKDALNFIYNEQDMSLLERQIISSDRAAVELAFALYSISDGAFGEELDIMLGELIRINPKLFLEELYKHRDLVCCLDGLVANLGGSYVDRSESSGSYELHKRLDALKSVKGARFLKTRDECINELMKILSK
jgi:hypothetical protein